MTTINRTGSGLAQPAFESNNSIDGAISEKLHLQFRAGDSKGLQQRRNDLRNIFDSLSPTEAKHLYNKLKTRNDGDSVSKLFHDRLAKGSRTELLGILKDKFDPPTQSHLRRPTPGGGGINELGVEKHYEIKLSGEMKHRELNRSVIHGATTPGGGSTNEIRTNDQAGKEEMFMNASKDMTIDLANNRTHLVGNNENIKIGSEHILLDPEPSYKPLHIEDPPKVHISAHGSNEDPFTSATGFRDKNEIHPSDSAGSQDLSVHAMKDLNLKQGRDRHETVGVDETHNVRVGMNTKIGANMDVRIGADPADVKDESARARETLSKVSKLVQSMTGDEILGGLKDGTLTEKDINDAIKSGKLNPMNIPEVLAFLGQEWKKETGT
jgi:hypothetical protein